ncbi:hypothetical protein [Paraburkholderia sp. BL6669N2]|nr:hypothetical protein [Paraburkholderia sp. BL6669N2]
MNKKIESFAGAIVTAVQEIARVENICVFIELALARRGAYT